MVGHCVWSRNLNNGQAMARVGSQRHSKTIQQTVLTTNSIFAFIILQAKCSLILKFHPLEINKY